MSFSSRRLLLREPEFIHRRIILVIYGRNQDRAHGVSNLQAGVSFLGKNRPNRRTVIENNHPDRKRRFDSLSLMQMHGSERAQLPTPGKRFGLQLFNPSPANFTPIPLRRKKHVSASPAPPAMKSRLRRRRIKI
jgi:hypothetical protein